MPATQEIPATELGRTAILMQEAHRFVERRTEQIEFVGDSFWHVQSRLQVHVPFHHQPANGNGTNGTEANIVLPLGTFSKARYPDLVVTGPTGERLPTLARANRAYVTASILVATRLQPIVRAFDDSFERERKILVLFLSRQIGRICVSDEQTSRESILECRAYLQAFLEVREAPLLPGFSLDRARQLADRILKDQRFFDTLALLASRTPLYVHASMHPGRSHEVTISYSERFAYVRRPAFGVPILGRSRDRIIRSLVWFGLTSAAVIRECPNADNCESFYLTVSCPEGTEPVRFFWEHEQAETANREEIIDCDRATVANYSGEQSKSAERQFRASLDIQIQPSAGILSALILSMALWMVTLYVYQRMPQMLAFKKPNPPAGFDSLKDGFNSTAALLAGAPAALLGAFAYRGASFARRLSRGLRMVLYLEASSSLFLAAMLPLRDLDQLTESVALVSSCLALLAWLVLAHVQLGPRFRHSDSSRIKRWTNGLSHRSCQSWQRRCAAFFVVAVLLVVPSFARIAYALQSQRILTPQFPGNVWRALREWF